MIEARLLNRLQRKKTQLDDLRPLPAAAVRRLNEQLTVEWIYNSNAIEGSTLTLKETQLILETGLTIGGKSLREHFEVINHKQAIEYVEALSTGEASITPFHVRQIHQLVLTHIDDDNAGQYRNLPVYITGTAYEPPEAWEVVHLMSEWGDWLNGPALLLHPVERAALAHHRLVAIHPFIDGNGRTARVLATLILYLRGFDAKQFFCLDDYYDSDRQAYYKALQNVNQDTLDLTKWLEYFIVGVNISIGAVKERVIRLSSERLRKTKRGQIALTERQMKIIEFINQNGRIRNKDAREMFKISDRAALKEIRKLMDLEVIKTEGKGRSLSYVLA